MYLKIKENKVSKRFISLIELIIFCVYKIRPRQFLAPHLQYKTFDATLPTS